MSFGTILISTLIVASLIGLYYFFSEEVNHACQQAAESCREGLGNYWNTVARYVKTIEWGRVTFNIVLGALAGYFIAKYSGIVWGVGAGTAISLVLLWNSFAIIPEQTVAVPSFLYQLSSRHVREGIHFTLPFIEHFREEYQYPSFQRKVTTNVEFYTGEKKEGKGDDEDHLGQLRIETRVIAPFTPDLSRHNNKGNVAFLDVVGPNMENEDVLTERLEKRIQNELGQLGGLYRYSTFIDNFGAVVRFINCILRLGTPPHVNPRENLLEALHPKGEGGTDQEEYNALEKALQNSEFVGDGKEDDDITKEVRQHNRIEFYREFSGPIGRLLNSEEERENTSDTEDSLGVDFAPVKLKPVSFKGDAKNAIQAKAERAAEMKAAKETQKERLEQLSALKDAGVDPNEALGSVDATLGVANKQTISIPGLESAASLLLERLGS